MRKLIITALMAAVALPGVASAQSQGELRRDRQDIREERRELRDARQRGDRRDIRDERGDLREARQEYREDRRDRFQDRNGYQNRNGFNDRNRNWGRNDWQGYRNQNRALYARGNWRAPFRYNNFRVGGRIGPQFYGQRYWINDPWRYRLPAARVNSRWVRHYNDVVLVDYRRGIVLNTIRNFYW
ncbi:RcnB family protein [Sphingomonas radiodurans]|uniref:RcnB family protein n=1 Tax=Sphingomonas radiodurans TaxID=2890321 RepID=UPI001E44593D|nr:RcnB family protein [Sphingomonas radiodurans]WBH15226.1 RcnB family protein [Sphingomonas radiodurans]